MTTRGQTRRSLSELQGLILRDGMLKEPNEARRDAYFAREMAFADSLEAKTLSTHRHETPPK